MTGYEHESQEVIADVVVDCGVEIGHRHLLCLELATELFVFPFEECSPAKQVDSPMLRGRHEPGAGLVGDAGLRPLFECGDERILREILGQTDVAHDAGETGDEPGRFDPPDSVNGAMDVGRGHGYRSHHLYSVSASDIGMKAITERCECLPRGLTAETQSTQRGRRDYSALPADHKLFGCVAQSHFMFFPD